MKLDPYYSKKELLEMGFKALGRQVLVSRTCRIYTPEQISLGSHVLIDDFTILNGAITVGSYVHISSNCELYAGKAGVTICDFAGMSSRCTLYATSDDYSGACLTNPTVPAAFRREIAAPITMEKHVILGAGCVVLPGVCMAEGCSFGAMSLINRSTEPWGVYAGIPARRLRERSRDLLEQEKKLAGQN